MSYNNQTAKETEKSLQLLSKNYTTFFMKSSGKKKKEKNQLIQLVLPVVYKRWLRPKQLDQNYRNSTARIGIQLVIQTKIFTSVVSWKLRRAESKLSAKKPLRTGIVGDTCRLQSVSIHQLKENREKKQKIQIKTEYDQRVHRVRHDTFFWSATINAQTKSQRPVKFELYL